MDIPVRRTFDPWVGVDTFERPTRLIDQYFGAGLDNDEFFLPASRSYSRYPFRAHPQRLFRPSSWTTSSAGDKDTGVSEMKVGKEKFSVKLDVHQFTPEELVVKTKDNNLIIEASHEEKEDPHGFISRQFVRRYILPDDVRPESIVVNLSSDGVLAVEAPRVTAGQKGENVIPINQTGMPAVVTSPQQPSSPAVQTAQSAPIGTGRNITIEKEGAPASASS